jgi:hypothetical protein
MVIGFVVGCDASAAVPERSGHGAVNEAVVLPLSASVHVPLIEEPTGLVSWPVGSEKEGLVWHPSSGLVVCLTEMIPVNRDSSLVN